MGYHGRYIAKQSKDNNIWKVVVEEIFTEDSVIIDLISDSNVALKIATQLNVAYNLGSEHEKQAIKHKIKHFVFED